MVEHLTALRDAIHAVAHRDADQSDLLRLVHISRVIVKAHLRHLRPDAEMLASAAGFSIDDVVDDCITEMFGQIKSGRIPLLDKFVDNLEAPMERLSPATVFISYRTLLERRVEAQLAYLYFHNDPMNGYIHRAIQHTVRTEDTGLALWKDFRGLYLYPAAHDRLLDKPPFTVDEMVRVFATRLIGSVTLLGILMQMSGVLIDQVSRARTVAVVDSVLLVRRLENSVKDDFTDHELSATGLTEDERDEIYRLAMIVIQRKIVLSYLIDGKLTKAEAENLSEAMGGHIHAMLFDADGRPASLEQLRHQLAVNPDDYETRLRPKVEYLAKLARQEVSARLLREL